MDLRAIVDGVADLFPGADRQALRCLEDLVRKEVAERIKELEAALEPFARAAEHWDKCSPPFPDDFALTSQHAAVPLTLGYFRRARAVLTKVEGRP